MVAKHTNSTYTKSMKEFAGQFMQNERLSTNLNEMQCEENEDEEINSNINEAS